MNKKIFVLMFCMILLVGTITALEFDNKLTYTDDNKKVLIENLFGLPLIGTEIAEIKITSHKNLSKPIYVNSGDKVLVLEITGKEDYNNFIGDAIFKNLRTGKYEEVDYYWEKAIYGQVPNIIEKCIEQITLSNGTIYKECSKIQNGTKVGIVFWEKYNVQNIKEGENITLGIVVPYIPPMSIYDVYPKFFGKEIREWVIYSNIVYDAHGLTFNSQNARTIKIGMRMVSKGDYYLINFTTDIRATNDNYAYIYSDVGNALGISLANTTITNHVAEFGYLMTEGTKYWILVDNLASSWSGGLVGQITLPWVGVNIDLDAGWDGQYRDSGSTNIFIIKTVTTGEILPSMIVNITFPLTTTYNTNTLDLESTQVTENEGVCDSIWYSLNLGQTNSSRENCGTNWSSLSASEGSNTWTVYGNLTTGFLHNDTVDFTVDTTPSILFASPTPANNTLQSFTSLPINVTISEEFFQNITFDLYNSTFDNINSAFFSNSNRFVNFTLPYEDTFLYNVTTATTTNQINTTQTRTIVLDSSAPTLTIHQPSGIRNGTTIPYNITFNFTAIDGLLQACSFTSDFNSTETIVLCNSSQEVSIIVPIHTSQITHNITLFANDSLGNVINVTTDFWPVFVEHNQDFTASTTEGNTETFRINITLAPNKVLSRTDLVYNNTVRGGTFVNIAEDNYTLTKTITTPIFSTSQNVSFFWNITTSDENKSRSSSQIQEVSAISLFDCNTGGILMLNYTIRDEETQAIVLNGSGSNFVEAEVEINIFKKGLRDESDVVASFSKFYVNITQPQVCITSELLNNSEFEMDVLIRYEANGKVSEFNNIQNFTLNSNTIPKDINLFDLASADSTNFLITFKDQDFLLASDVLVDITRKYISEGVFKSVEVPKTDTNGQTVAHLVEADVIYTLIFKKHGTILATFTNVIAVCRDPTIGDCKLNLNAFQEGVAPTDWETFGNLDTSFVFDEDARTITLTFSTLDGTSATVQLNGTQFSRLGNNSICSTSLTSSSGTLVCNIPASFGNVTVYSQVYNNGVLIQSGSFTIAQLTSEIFGGAGLFFVLILVLTIPFMFIESKEGVIIGSLVGLITASLFNVYEGGSLFGVGSTLIYLIIVAVIFIWRLSKK